MTFSENSKTALLAALCSLTCLTHAQFVAKPYLQLGGDRQMGSAKSLTLVWHAADRKADWKVKVQNGGREGNVKNIVHRTVNRAGAAPHRVYTAVLSNLIAGLPVKYEVSVDGATVFRGTGMAPKAPNQPFRFAILGDTGRGTPAQRKVMAAMHGQRPDFVAVAGDVVYPRGTMSEYRANFFPFANADSTGPAVGAPSMRSTLWVAAPGNHDTAYRNATGGLAFYDYWIQPRGGPAPGCFTFQYGNAHWTVIDSNTYLDWTAARNRAWLEVALMAGKRSTWSFVLLHHPPYHSSRTHAGDTFMRKSAGLFTQYGVQAVFGGHIHNYQRSHPIATNSKGWKLGKGPVYIVSGAGGAELYDQKQAASKATWKPFTAAFKAGYSFTVVDVKDRTLALRQLTPEGKVLDSLTLRSDR